MSAADSENWPPRFANQSIRRLAGARGHEVEVAVAVEVAGGDSNAAAKEVGERAGGPGGAASLALVPGHGVGAGAGGRGVEVAVAVEVAEHDAVGDGERHGPARPGAAGAVAVREPAEAGVGGVLERGHEVEVAVAVHVARGDAGRGERKAGADGLRGPGRGADVPLPTDARLEERGRRDAASRSPSRSMSPSVTAEPTHDAASSQTMRSVQVPIAPAVREPAQAGVVVACIQRRPGRRRRRGPRRPATTGFWNVPIVWLVQALAPARFSCQKIWVSCRRLPRRTSRVAVVVHVGRRAAPRASLTPVASVRVTQVEPSAEAFSCQRIGVVMPCA